ncbi:MAG: GNAT family N-acetyltransferase [Alphaproteobacteria bacterium]|nr:GNAT family N-acetyltransferase [Alphaproteobacteria bacterium]
MALLDWISADLDLRLSYGGVRLRPHRSSDFSAWSSLREASRAFLQPWEPTWPSDDLTRGAYRRRLAAYSQDMERGVAYPFLVFRKSDDTLVGGITLSNIRRGVAQMGSIGYWVGQAHTRQGYTTDAVKAVSCFAFDRLGLHRVEAACLPSNAASRGVLLKAGFDQEGLARAYLKIDGAWRDHLLFGLLSPALRERL